MAVPMKIVMYGSVTHGQVMDEDSPLPPDTPYGRSKVAAEEVLRSVAGRTALEVITQRPSPILSTVKFEVSRGFGDRGAGDSAQDPEHQKPEPTDQEAEVVAGRCQDRVGDVAVDLAADVAAESPEACAQELERTPRALELMGMPVVPDHDRGPLGHPQIALALGHALAPGQRRELLDGPVDEPRIGRMRDRLRL